MWVETHFMNKKSEEKNKYKYEKQEEKTHCIKYIYTYANDLIWMRFQNEQKM